MLISWFNGNKAIGRTAGGMMVYSEKLICYKVRTIQV